VEVQVGSFKVRRPQGDLRRASRPEERRSSPPVQATVTARSAPLEMEIRGMRVADVEDTLDRYLNDAYLAGLPFVRIIHGKGTGRLRQVIREALKNSAYISTFEEGGDKEGGEGVTIAHLSEV
jgi:DNA mismatch repair protein MutS2